jgi:prepilin-type N-terminal cleavage/methylation domain-containing protein
MKLYFFGLTKRQRALFKTKAAFTMIELLVTIAIAATVISLGVIRYNSFNKQQAVDSVGKSIMNHLRDIQAKATAGVKPAACTSANRDLQGYRVYFLDYDPPVPTVCGVVDCIASRAVCGGSELGPWTYYNLPAAFDWTYETADFMFLGLGAGTDLEENLIIDSQAYTSPTYYHKLCVGRSGGISNCGFQSNSGFACSC